MSENRLMNRYVRACVQEREEELYDSEYVDIDDNISISHTNTIRIEVGSRYYLVEYNDYERRYVMVGTNHPAIRQQQ